MQRVLIFFFSLLSATCLLLPPQAHAQSASDLQAQIDQHNAQIKALDAEIAQYQAQLDTLGKQKTTLQSTVNTLATSQKQLAAQIKVTQNNIASANIKLQQLSLSIGDTQLAIRSDQAAVAKSLRSIAEGDQQPLIASLLSARSLAEGWRAADATIQFNRAMEGNINNLADAEAALAASRSTVAATKSKLQSLNSNLSTQKSSVDASKAAQQSLLAQTKNKESSYQALIAQKKAAELSFEQELNSLQSQLNLVVNPGSLPKVGMGVLSWPYSIAFGQSCQARKKVFGNLFCVTQYFGTTAFSTANPQVYNGKGHDGIDIGMPVGTPIQASLGGTVLGIGNTDIRDSRGRMCYSFGKWVMVKHGDGLNTLYAHLSVISVSQGQSVSTGTLLGLSGMTGYATGPHLHFGVYATQGTKIMDLGSFRGTGGTPCTDAGAVVPVATNDAYLNPLSYL